MYLLHLGIIQFYTLCVVLFAAALLSCPWGAFVVGWLGGGGGGRGGGGGGGGG